MVHRLASLSVWVTSTCAWLCMATSVQQLGYHGVLGGAVQSVAGQVDAAVVSLARR